MIKAAIFDVFGTCVDWRTSVAREVSKYLPGIDPLSFADAWRAEYDPAMERIRAGGRGYVPLEVLHRENLDRVLPAFNVQCECRDELNSAWEKLDPWPDVVNGLNTMKQALIIAPCSNGSIALMTRLAKHAELPWDCILGAEIAKDYKPKPMVYTSTVRALRLDPQQVVMVAAHNDDLEAARGVGMKTAFVPRPTEYGPNQAKDLEPTSDWDCIAPDFKDLAKQLVSA